jgi:hypothetical protein
LRTFYNSDGAVNRKLLDGPRSLGACSPAGNGYGDEDEQCRTQWKSSLRRFWNKRRDPDQMHAHSLSRSTGKAIAATAALRIVTYSEQADALLTALSVGQVWLDLICVTHYMDTLQQLSRTHRSLMGQGCFANSVVKMCAIGVTIIGPIPIAAFCRSFILDNN